MRRVYSMEILSFGTVLRISISGFNMQIGY